MNRVFDSMKQAAGSTDLSIDEIKRAKDGGCPAFRSNRIYEAELRQWLADNPDVGDDDDDDNRMGCPDCRPGPVKLSDLNVKSSLHGASLLCAIFQCMAFEYHEPLKAVAWMTAQADMGKGDVEKFAGKKFLNAALALADALDAFADVIEPYDMVLENKFVGAGYGNDPMPWLWLWHNREAFEKIKKLGSAARAKVLGKRRVKK